LVLCHWPAQQLNSTFPFVAIAVLACLLKIGCKQTNKQKIEVLGFLMREKTAMFDTLVLSFAKGEMRVC
jgi:hypothetical protein